VRVEKVRPPRDKGMNGKEEGSACMRSYVVRFVEDGWMYEGREGRSSRCHVNSLVGELIDCSIVDGMFCFFFLRPLGCSCPLSIDCRSRNSFPILHACCCLAVARQISVIDQRAYRRCLG
jgi:hypothetical protein